MTFETTVPVDLDKHPAGEELAEYLKKSLIGGGLPVTVIDNYEDFAWSLDVNVDDRKLFFLVGYVGDEVHQWLMQIRNYSGLMDLFHRKQIRAACDSLAPHLHKVLAADPLFSNIRWHVGDFAQGTFADRPDAD